MTNKKMSNNENRRKKTIIVTIGILVSIGLAILVAHIVEINAAPSISNMSGTYMGGVGGDGDGLIVLQTESDGTCVFGILKAIAEDSTTCKWWISDNDIYVSSDGNNHWGKIQFHILSKDRLLISDENGSSINNKIIERT